MLNNQVNMKKSTFIIVVIFLLTGCSVTSKDDFITRSMNSARQQALLMAEYMSQYPGMLPRTYDQDQDSIFIVNSQHWVSGFFPGSLWYLYDFYNDEKLKKMPLVFFQGLKRRNTILTIMILGSKSIVVLEMPFA
jgi:unsaturated chondroitin disaccharide hydrolase